MNSISCLIIGLLCWCTRTFQCFRGRWRLMKWLKGKDSLMKEFGSTKVKMPLGVKMIVSPYEFVGRHIFVEGIYEPECTKVFLSLLRPGDCVLDVGANIGYFTLLSSSLVGSEGQVHAFEASPEIVQMLQKNIRLNHVNNVVIHNEAVLDRLGFVKFYTGPEENLGLSCIQNTGKFSQVDAEVPCVKIDHMISTFPLVRLVKIDVEGAEFLVAKGMPCLIDRDKPYIILEFTETLLQQMGCDAVTLFNYLAKCNYSLYEICSNGVRIINIPPNKQCNILAVHKTFILPASISVLAE